MSRSMIVVVGCNHGIQPRDPDWLAGDTQQATKQKEYFARLIGKIVMEREGKFVAEEWGLPCATSAHAIAAKCGIPWSDINTCCHDLDRMGTPRDYVNGHYSDEDKSRWNREREDVMLERIKHFMKEGSNGLVICGFDHMRPFLKLLQAEVIKAQPMDYRKQEWYQPTFSGDT